MSIATKHKDVSKKITQFISFHLVDPLRIEDEKMDYLLELRLLHWNGVDAVLNSKV